MGGGAAADVMAAQPMSPRSRKRRKQNAIQPVSSGATAMLATTIPECLGRSIRSDRGLDCDGQHRRLHRCPRAPAVCDRGPWLILPPL